MALLPGTTHMEETHGSKTCEYLFYSQPRLAGTSQKKCLSHMRVSYRRFVAKSVHRRPQQANAELTSQTLQSENLMTDESYPTISMFTELQQKDGNEEQNLDGGSEDRDGQQVPLKRPQIPDYTALYRI